MSRPGTRERARPGEPARPGGPPAAGRLTPPPQDRLPDGLVIELAGGVHRSRDGRLLLGGSPPRLLRLSAAAARLLAPGRFTVSGPATAALARRLVDVGAAHPRPAAAEVRDVTIVIPVRDRAGMLDRLLTALRADGQTAALPVLVVDDGSADRAAVADAARRHGAVVLAHPANRGPAAARNTGLNRAQTAFVAFCDSDVQPEPGWLGPLLAQFTDPALALAAPRVIAAPDGGSGWLDRYEQVRSPLDMGAREGPVVPMSALAYVPSAALVVRRTAVGPGFDPQLRVGEDVDLCLRLHEAGWRLRYLPAARVGHSHRTSLRSWLAQRASYGSSAAALAVRHPGKVPPLNAATWSVAACALVLRGRPRPAAAAAALTAAAAVRLTRKMPDADTPVRAAALLTLAGLRGTAEQLAQCATRHYWPAAALAAAADRRARGLLLAVAVADGLADWRRSSANLNPVVFVAIRRLDDLAYGTGLWRGALAARTVAPLVPRISLRAGGAGRRGSVPVRRPTRRTSARWPGSLPPG
ncbi:MAG: mycofactocin biosynthesis glycosyltransferase MftF [Streptosporangiaceae bacterium]